MNDLSIFITVLEESPAVPLFIQTTRSVTPNEADQTLADGIASLLIEMRSVLKDVSSTQQAIRGVLKLNVTGAVMLIILHL